MKVIHSHFIFAAGAGLIGLLIAAVYFMASVLAVAEFIISVVDFILSVGIFLVIGGVILIVGGIFFMLWSSDPSSAIMFLMTSIFLLGAFGTVGRNLYLGKEDGLRRMNQIRRNSTHHTEDELLSLMSNYTIDEFERIGYMAAFADRHPPIKNLPVAP